MLTESGGLLLAATESAEVNNPWLKSYLPLIISVTALLFAVGTFYWNNWRTGTLLVSQPRAYSASGAVGRIKLVLPLAFRNTGPTTLVVRALRVRFYAPEDFHLDYVRTRPTVSPEKGEIDFAINFIVPGRDAKVLCCEFEAVSRTWHFPSGMHQVELLGLLDGSDHWRLLGSLKLWFDPAHAEQLTSSYVTYDNRGALP